MSTFWSVLLIWLGQFAFITILVERALYRNVNRGSGDYSNYLSGAYGKVRETKEAEAEMSDSRNATRWIRALPSLFPWLDFLCL